MKSMMDYCGLGALLLAGSLSCAEQQNTVTLRDTQSLRQGSIQLMSEQLLQVTDSQGQPVAGAAVLIGYAPGNPFAGNLLTTDAQGRAALPAEWQTALPVTVEAPGFVTASNPSAEPGALTLSMRPSADGQEFEVSGSTTGFGRLVTDGKVDFALMIPGLDRENLLSFDLSTVISPQVDTISIIGNEVSLPSNISLPRQTENYVFPITLDKPAYRAYFRQGGPQVISATHGQFPLQRVVSDIRAGKSMFELINHFTFLEGGEQTLNLQGNVADINLAVNQTAFNQQVAVRAPAYPAGHQMVSLSVVEKDQRFIPADLKRLNANQTMNLKSFGDGGAQMMFSMLIEASRSLSAALTQPLTWFKPLLPAQAGPAPMAAPVQDFSRLSFTLQPAAGGVAPQFLPLVAKPSLADDTLTLEVPTLIAGLAPVATYLALSEVEQITTGNVVSERRTLKWEMWSARWLDQVILPKIEIAKRPDRTYRWEVMFMARPANFVDAAPNASKVDLKTITHVTRNSLDI